LNGSFTSHGNYLTLSFKEQLNGRALETEMRECLVGFCHTMHFLTLLHRCATTFGRLDQLCSQTQTHGLLAALACCIAQPAHRQGTAATRTHFDRHLIVSTTDATALDFDDRAQVVDGSREHLESVLAALLRDLI